MMIRVMAVSLVLVGFFAAGCGDQDPSSDRIRATNYREFMWWRGQVARNVPSQRWAAFNGAVDEIRYDLMAEGLTGSDAIGEALAARINRMSFDDVLRLGDQLKLARLIAVRDELKTMVDANALVGTKTDDNASREALDRRATEQRDRLDGILRQIEAVRAQLVADGGTRRPEQAVTSMPAAISREQARADYFRLVRQRLDNAEIMYGDWPARVDRTGDDLPPDLRTEFDAKRGLSVANGHVVIPVFIRARWRLFDGVVPYPQFSAAVTANLTAEDRRELEQAWADSEAVVWARREAKKESADAAIAHIKDDLKNVMRP